MIVPLKVPFPLISILMGRALLNRAERKYLKGTVPSLTLLAVIRVEKVINSVSKTIRRVSIKKAPNLTCLLENKCKKH